MPHCDQSDLSTALARALLDRFSPDFLELADTGADYLAALVLLPRPITAAQLERRRRLVNALTHITTYIKREAHQLPRRKPRTVANIIQQLVVLVQYLPIGSTGMIKQINAVIKTVGIWTLNILELGHHSHSTYDHI